MNSVVKWSEKIAKDDRIIVLGNDSIVTRMVDYFGTHLESDVYLIDPEIDATTFSTSAFAYELLQNKVKHTSGIDPRTRDTLNTRKNITKKKTVLKTVYKKKDR
ncbi:MAG: hypothetical protein ACTSPM_14290 [Candidatus Heimdallarchaeota archaeon]